MELLKAYALSFLGKPYCWGGETPMGGMDCSGLVQEILRSCGMDPPGDQTAQALFDHFQAQGRAEWNKYGLGALVFYGKSVREISHVAWGLDQYRVIEAAGAGSDCKSEADAIRLKAFVRIRPMDYRKDRVAVLKPRYVPIGVV